jgi:hypothetical protein
MKINLPRADGTLASYTLRAPGAFRPAKGRHAVQPHRVLGGPRGGRCARRRRPVARLRDRLGQHHRLPQRLWGMGLGVAEAMDTAQRGMGLDWPTSLELIRRSLDAAGDTPGALVACGCGTDQLAPDAANSVDDVIRAYEEQMAAIEKLGGRLIVMASRALARVAKSPADYERVYDRVLSQARQPVILHWLGDMFDPALKGYWGSDDIDAAMATALGIIGAHASQGRRHQDLAARQGQRDRDAPPAARHRRGRRQGRAHVHRRRLQLRRADRRRRRRRLTEPAAQRRAARHLRRDRTRGECGAGRAGRR